MEYIASILGAIGGIVGIVFGFYQYAFNKRTDYKIERQRAEDVRWHIEATARLSDIYSKLYGYLHRIMFNLDADRVYIIQPHPLAEKQFISISMEVVHTDRGVADHKANFQNRRFPEWAGIIARLSSEDWYVVRNIRDVRDVKVYAELHRRGVQTVVYRRLVNAEKHWIGTLCVEYTHTRPESLDQIKAEIMSKAHLIADILPEYIPTLNTKRT